MSDKVTRYGSPFGQYFHYNQQALHQKNIHHRALYLQHLSIYIIGMSFDPRLSALELKNEGMQIIDRIAITTNNKNKKSNYTTTKKQANTKILCNWLTKLQTGQLWADELYSWKNLPMYSYNQKNK